VGVVPIQSEFSILAANLCIVRFSCPRHNEFATRAAIPRQRRDEVVPRGLRLWNHQAFWSGRWESNPTLYAAKRLIPLVNRSGLASISVQFQFRRYLFDCFTVSISYNVPIDFKSSARVGVAELPLYDLRRGAGVE
jgi:hypothetical protein